MGKAILYQYFESDMLLCDCGICQYWLNIELLINQYMTNIGKTIFVLDIRQ